MKFKPSRQVEHEDARKHSDWTEVDSRGDMVFIKCTCHSGDEQGMRWIFKSQLRKGD